MVNNYFRGFYPKGEILKYGIPDAYKNIVKIGKGVTFHTGCVVGGEGFHYKRDGLKFVHSKFEHGVDIGDDVHVHANCTIDRGRWRGTKIGSGTIIDAQTHVGHDVHIGKGCIISCEVSLLGSVNIGDGAEVWADAVIHQRVTIGKNSVVGANTYLRKDVPDNHVAYMNGNELVIKPKNTSKYYSK